MTEEQLPRNDTDASSSPADEGALPMPVLVERPSEPAPRWRTRLMAALPHVITILFAVALTLAIQQALPHPEATIILPVRPTLAPTAPQPTGIAPTPAVPQPQPDERVLSQEILDLQVRIDELWSAVYIVRAAGQLADAETALRTNDTAEVERVLVAVDAALALAYDRSGDLNKGPISEFRAQVGQIRDDLYVRPEGLDQKLSLLRQRMLSLVEAP